METVSITIDEIGSEPEVYRHLLPLDRQGLSVTQNEPGQINVGPVIEIPAGIVVAGISALAAVIGSLLTFLAHNSTGKIVIKGSSGRTIEVPRDTPHEQLEYLIEQARAIDAATIVIERGVSTSQVWK